MNDVIRHEIGEGSLEEVLLLKTEQLVPRRQRVSEIDDIPVEKREPSLHGVGHEHPVALRGEDVASKQRRHLQPLAPAQRIPFLATGRHSRNDVLGASATDLVPQVTGQHILDRRG